MLKTENVKKFQEKCNKRGKLCREYITYNSPCNGHAAPFPENDLSKPKRMNSNFAGIVQKLRGEESF